MSKSFLMLSMSLAIVCAQVSLVEASLKPIKSKYLPYDADGNEAEDAGWDGKDDDEKSKENNDNKSGRDS